MTTKVRKRLRALFTILAVLAIAQLAWWSYLLVDQQATISELLATESAKEREFRFVLMILAEGGFWFVMWSVGLFAIYRTFTQERRLYQAHRDFLSAITHELKTPIAGIQLGLEALKKDLSPEKREAFIKRSLESTDRLKNQIDHILSLNQQANISPKAFVNANIKKLVDECISESSQEIDRPLTWSNEVDPKIEIFVQRQALKLILKSVIDNALKYGSIPDHAPEHLKINISYRNSVLLIEDNGIGFDESPDNLFIDFFRGKIAKELAVPGTGVGLSVAKQIAEKLKWDLEIHSPGRNQGCVCKIKVK